MSEMKEMYGILKEMLRYLEEKKLNEISDLNKSFETAYRKVFQITDKGELALKYDNCRQSCMTPINFPDMYEEALTDAKEWFSKIPEPEE
ncbi:MAG: hypothetical protein GTN76_15780 [Candidatus Aenigmarchaeota archaeon]|nr:hypothetical protein [Candidatus Aenigmarchaeota archaeon]